MINYVDFCYGFFGDFSRSVRTYFLDIREDLQKAGMNYTLDEYLATAFFTTTATFVIEYILMSFIFGIVLTEIFSALFLALTMSLTISGLLFFLFYSYPSTVSKSRESKIRKSLPFSISYMATVSSSKLMPINIFKTLGGFKEYGELAEESRNIVRDVEVFGMTFSAAIRKQAKATPSHEFKDVLWGINTVIASGGDITIFLKQKSDELMNDYRRRIRKYSQDLGLFVEIYLTLIITGAIFFIVLSSVMTAMSPGLGTIGIQSFVVFILLPLLSIGFIVMIKGISPME